MPRFFGKFELLLAGFVILIACILVLLYKPTSTTIPNQNWKIYTNDYYNFTINIPSNWQVYSIFPSDKYEDGTPINLNSIPYFSIKSGKNFISFKQESYMYPNKTFEKNAAEWLTYYLSSTAGLGNSSPHVINEENISIGDKTGKKYTINYQDPGNSPAGTAIWIYLPFTKGELISIKYSSMPANLDQLNQYSTIISSLKFIKPQSP